MSSAAESLAYEALAFGRQCLRDPAGAGDRLHRAIGIVRGTVLFRTCEHGPHLCAYGRVRVVAQGAIRLGERVTFVSGMIPTELVSQPGAELVIGSRCVFNYGVSIRAARSIHIGDGCLFGSMVRIRDSDEDVVGPVVVGDDVWLSHGVIVEPGVTIGDGSVVAAGSVVRHSVPPGMLASGNPAVCAPLNRMDSGASARARASHGCTSDGCSRCPLSAGRVGSKPALDASAASPPRAHESPAIYQCVRQQCGVRRPP